MTTKNQLFIQLLSAICALEAVRVFYISNVGGWKEEPPMEKELAPLTEFCKNFLREVPNLKEFEDLLDKTSLEYFEDLEVYMKYAEDPNVSMGLPDPEKLVSAKNLNEYSAVNLHKLFFIWMCAKMINPYYLYKEHIERYSKEIGDFSEVFEFEYSVNMDAYEERKRFLKYAKVFKRFTFK